MNFPSVHSLGDAHKPQMYTNERNFMISTRLAAQLTITRVYTVSTSLCPVTHCVELYRHPSPPSLRVSPPIEVCTQPCRSSRQCMFLLWVEQLH